MKKSMLGIMTVLLGACARTHEHEPNPHNPDRYYPNRFYSLSTYRSHDVLHCNVHNLPLKRDTVDIVDPGGDVEISFEQHNYYPNSFSSFPGLHGSVALKGMKRDVWFCDLCRKVEASRQSSSELQQPSGTGNGTAAGSD